MVVIRLGSRNSHRQSPPPMEDELRLKLIRIVSHHDQLKISFHQLQSQIKIGLREAEDVFASLAIPLSRLVGLKTVEMAEEGKSSTILMKAPAIAHDCWRDDSGTEANSGSPKSSVSGVDQNSRILKSEEDYTARAMMASKELIEKQRLQLTQLVHLLKQIQSQVNSSQSNIYQTIADHQASMQRFFQKAITYVSNINQSNHDSSGYLITLKLLKVTFDHVRTVLGSVENGVDDLMQELAEKMCTPMVEYVKSLKAEMTTGTCPQLLTVMEEMGGAMRDRKFELEEARMKVRVAEEMKLDALSRLRESEETVRRMKEHLLFILKAKKGSLEHFAGHKYLGLAEDQATDEKLLWELLKQKRRYLIPDSPLGPKELLSIGSNNGQPKSTRARPPVSYKLNSKSYRQGASPQTPRLDSWLHLGSSPSATTQQVLPRKRIRT